MHARMYAVCTRLAWINEDVPLRARRTVSFCNCKEMRFPVVERAMTSSSPPYLNYDCPQSCVQERLIVELAVVSLSRKPRCLRSDAKVVLDFIAR